MTADVTASHLVERLHQIAESQRMDHDSPHVGTTLEEVATLIEQQADQLAAAETKIAQIADLRDNIFPNGTRKLLDVILSASPVSALDAVAEDVPIDGQCDELDGAGRRCYWGKGHDQHGISHSYSVDEGPYRAALTGESE